MNAPMTVVTAYFNIGRDSFKAVPRAEERYFEEFRFWARLRNPLVVFTEPRCALRVMEIRSEFGLADQTIIIEIEDIFAIEPQILERMRATSATAEFRDFRLLPDATSGIADYSYLMLLKTWFLAQTVVRGHAGENVAWVDFSYNRGGLVHSNPSDYAFTWISEPLERINLFLVNDYDERPIFEIVRQLSDCIMGSPIVAPSGLAGFLWESNRLKMESLLDVGFIDDDQLIQLMSYRAAPELYELHRSAWFRPIENYSNEQFSLTQHPERGPIMERVRRLVHFARKRRLSFDNARRLYRNLAKSS